MENCDNTIPKNKKGKKLAIKKRNIKSVKAAAAEKVRTYGIYSLNLAATVNEAENDSIKGEDNAFGKNSELLPAYRRIVQT